MAKIRRFTAFFMALTVALTAFVVPVYATDYQSKYNFWNWAYDHSWFLGKLITGAADNVCAVSEDSLHHSTNHSAGGLVDGEYTYTCICDHCGQTFTAIATNLQETYEKETPDYTIDNTGAITDLGEWELVPSYTGFTHEMELLSDAVLKLSVDGDWATYPSYFLRYRFSVPANTDVYIAGQFGIYKKDDVEQEFQDTRPLNWLCRTVDGSNASIDAERVDPTDTSCVYHFNSGSFADYYIRSALTNHNTHDVVDLLWYVPVVNYSVPVVDITDAPISGGGSISYVDDNSNNEIIENQFFDQSTNTYHNPVTDTSSTVESWEYDYSTRTYTGHTENGDVLIQYGDENITVTEGNNIYHYYYTAPDGSGGNGGSGGSGDGSDDDGESIWDKLGNLLGDLVGGLLDLISGVISGLLDSLIDLVSVTLEKLGSIVDLFGSFGDALKSLWSWLPEDIVTILAAGVSVVVFASVIKLFI